MEAQRPEGMTTSKNRGWRVTGCDHRPVLTKAHCCLTAASCSRPWWTFHLQQRQVRSSVPAGERKKKCFHSSRCDESREVLLDFILFYINFIPDEPKQETESLPASVSELKDWPGVLLSLDFFCFTVGGGSRSQPQTCNKAASSYWMSKPSSEWRFWVRFWDCCLTFSEFALVQVTSDE